MAIRLDLNLHSGSAAFAPDFARVELGRILRLLATKIEGGSDGEIPLRDVNGNRCGGAFIEIWNDEEAEA